MSRFYSDRYCNKKDMKMKINHANNLSFKGNIIDSHGHLGFWSPDRHHCSPEEVMRVIGDSFELNVNGNPQTDEVECVLVSNLECLDTQSPNRKGEIEGNLALLEQCRKNPKLKAEAVCLPDVGNAENIDRLLTEHGEEFHALKFHPQCSGIDANSPLYEPYMKVAENHKKTCVFHSDNLYTFSSPRKIYELAKKTPNVPVVLYHMSMTPWGKITERPLEDQKAKGLEGVDDCVWNYRERWNRDGITVAKEALDKGDANLYLECSWTKPETVVEAIKTVGADRVLFGTDIPLDPNQPGNREWYKNNIREIQAAIRNDKDIPNPNEVISKVFFENSNKLFFDGKLKKSIGQTATEFVERSLELIRR